MADQTHRTVLQIDADTSKIDRLGDSLDRSLDSASVDRLIDRLEKLDSTIERLIAHQGQLAAATNATVSATSALAGSLPSSGGAATATGGLGGAAAALGSGWTGTTVFGPITPVQAQIQALQAQLQPFQQQAQLAGLQSQLQRAQNPSSGLSAAAGISAAAGGPMGVAGLLSRLGPEGAAAAALMYAGYRAVGSASQYIASGQMFTIPGLTGGIGNLVETGILGGGVATAAFGGMVPAAALYAAWKTLGKAPAQQILGTAGAAASTALDYYRTKADTAYFTGQDTSVVESLGARFGMGPTASVRAASQFYQQIGGEQYGGAEGFYAALAGRDMGVDLGTSAALYRTLRRGAGGSLANGPWRPHLQGGQAVVTQQAMAPGDMLASMLATAGSLGLQGSDRSEYVAQLVNFAQGRGSQGIQTDYAATMGITTGLGGLEGIQSGTAARVGTQLANRFTAVGKSGPRDALDVAVLRAAGWGSGKNFVQASFAAQHPDAAMLGRLVERVQGAGGSADEKAWIMQQVMERMGAPVGEEMARDLVAQGIHSKGFVFESQNLLSVKAEKQRAEAGKGHPEYAAETEGKQLALGKQVLQAEQELARAQVDLAANVKHLVPLLNALAGAVAGAVQKINTVLDNVLPDPEPGPTGAPVPSGGYGGGLGPR